MQPLPLHLKAITAIICLAFIDPITHTLSCHLESNHCVHYTAVHWTLKILYHGLGQKATKGHKHCLLYKTV